MCELFGLNGKKKLNIGSELCEFFSHAQDNPNGWGMALIDGRDSYIDKEDKRADKSDRLKGIMDGGICAKDAIAHIRLATVGYDMLENTHPFTAYDLSGREWIFAHNGTVFESGPLSPYFYVQDGETDSERILLYLIDCMNAAIKEKRGALDEDQRFNVLQDAIAGIANKNKLNLLIYDGEVLYTHTNCRDSLYFWDDGDGIYFSTKPLSRGTWHNVPFTRLVSYRDGRKLREGSSHGMEYIPDESSIRALYMAYAGL